MISNEVNASVEYLKRRALEDFIIENQKYLYRVAFSYVKSKDDAFEIVQNTIYKSLSSVKFIKDLNLLKPWITKILVNNCFDFFKYNRKFILSDEILKESSEDNSRVLDKIVLKKAMDKLSPKLKAIIILRFFEDFKIKDIAQILEMNESTVKTNLYKALKILKINLKEDLVNV